MSYFWGVCRSESDSLSHHGILGQKWGIRRFQNSDGSLTAEGKKRYNPRSKDPDLNNRFLIAEKIVSDKLSNSIPNFIEKPMDLRAVRNRGGVSNIEAKQCAELGNDIFNRSRSIEPRISEDVVSSVADSGSEMYGLNNRLKQPTSLAAKIGADAKADDISFEEAASKIKDAIRYTSVSEDENFVDNYKKTKKSLEEKGYTEKRCRNYFDLYSKGKVQHKSIQCIFSDEDGNLFELQFQTVSSQAAKELKIPLYEERRSKNVSPERAKQLEREMRNLAECVPYPPYIEDIKTYG